MTAPQIVDASGIPRAVEQAKEFADGFVQIFVALVALNDARVDEVLTRFQVELHDPATGVTFPRPTQEKKQP